MANLHRGCGFGSTPIPALWAWVKLILMRTGEIGTLRDIVANERRAVLGSDPRDIERIWYAIYDRTAFNVIGGAEMRILSAINIAQWDILGKSLGAPVYRLLGGKVRDKIRVYNTYTRGWIINGWQMDTDPIEGLRLPARPRNQGRQVLPL